MFAWGPAWPRQDLWVWHFGRYEQVEKAEGFCAVGGFPVEIKTSLLGRASVIVLHMLSGILIVILSFFKSLAGHEAKAAQCLSWPRHGGSPYGPYIYIQLYHVIWSRETSDNVKRAAIDYPWASGHSPSISNTYTHIGRSKYHHTNQQEFCPPKNK